MRTRHLLLACSVLLFGCAPRTAPAEGTPVAIPSGSTAPRTPPTTATVMRRWLALPDSVAMDQESCDGWSPLPAEPLTFRGYLADILSTLAEATGNDGERVAVVVKIEWKDAATLRQYWGDAHAVPSEGAWQCDAYFRVDTEPDPWHAGIRLYLTGGPHEQVGPVGCLF